jgi:tetratricopeptide (TPR) repeat protein
VAEGTAALIAGDAVEAERQLLEALAADPKNWVAARALAALYQQTKRLDDAIEQYQRAAAGRPDDPQLWSDYGVTWSQLGDEDKAAGCFRKALKIDPNFAPALRNAAINASERGDSQAALDLYTRSLKLDDENANAWYGRGVALFRLGCEDDAIEAFERCVAIDPNDVEAWKDLGTCFARKQSTKRAVAAWKKVMELDPQADIAGQLQELES